MVQGAGGEHRDLTSIERLLRSEMLRDYERASKEPGFPCNAFKGLIPTNGGKKNHPFFESDLDIYKAATDIGDFHIPAPKGQQLYFEYVGATADDDPSLQISMWPTGEDVSYLIKVSIVRSEFMLPPNVVMHTASELIRGQLKSGKHSNFVQPMIDILNLGNTDILSTSLVSCESEYFLLKTETAGLSVENSPVGLSVYLCLTFSSEWFYVIAIDELLWTNNGSGIDGWSIDAWIKTFIQLNK